MRVRVGLVTTAILAIAWFAAGVRSARFEERADATLGTRLAYEPRSVRAARLFERSRRFNPDTRPMLREAEVIAFAGRRAAGLRLIDEVIRREPDNVYAWNLMLQIAPTDPARVTRARARLRALIPNG
jgi:hypothetical protein